LSRLRRVTNALPFLLLAGVAYVPLLLTAPGRVAADTKTYLYLDPGRLLSRAWSMWDPNIGLGTVTHQTIGYLWPMGPWFWFWESVGAPDWVAQRLWVGTVMLAAGAGLVYLLRTLGIRSVPALVAAALVYELSPYVLHYAARISVILLPWAALPWLVALVHRALHSRSWRYPAAFALVVATAGGVNATALVLAGLGPLVWLVAAVLIDPDLRWRDAGRVVARFGALTTLCSLWWIAGLWVQGGWGIDILRYTETVETVARTSLSSEVLRGLGYWFFYGGDKLGAWIEPGRSYTQELWLIAAGFAVPLLAFAAAAVTRWRHRGTAVALVLLGTVIAVGAYPYGAPSPAGAAFKALATSSTVGLALRSTPRAIPLVALGLAVLIGAALAARRAAAPAIAVGLVALIGLPPLWTGDFIGENLQRPETIPEHWREAAAVLDGGDHGTRVWEIPGIDFASYRWGNTVDPITPGLIDRPYVARELIPYGTPAAADLLIAADRRIQEMVLDPDGLAAVARLLGVGDIVLRSDLQYERYRTPRPRTLYRDLRPTPVGLEQPRPVGAPVPNEAIDRLALRDEVFLATPADAPHPAPVEIFGVVAPLPIVRARAATAPIVVAGDGEGIVEAAAVGLLGGDSVVLSSAALTDEERRAAMEAGAVLVLTDTNRQRGRRWATLRDNAGYTEPRGETPLRPDPSDNRLPLFPGASDDAFTTVDLRGAAAVRATAYGNPVSFTPEDRPALALDGDLATAWQVGALDGVGGERWRLDVADPVRTSSINVVQALNPHANRWITRLEVRLDGEPVTTVDLDDRSRTSDGQDIDLGGERLVTALELVVRGDNVGKLARYDGFSGVGFAEVRVGGVEVEEVVRLPADLLRDGAAGHPLAIVLARMRSNPIEPTAGDEERAMARVFTLPEARSFRLSGQARVSADQPDDAVDRALGGTAVVRTSSRIGGDLTSRGVHAVDRDPRTAWTTAFGEQRGQWLHADLGAARSFAALDLRVRADGHHSVPTRLRVTTDAGDDVEAEVPPIADGGERGHVARVPVVLPERVRGQRVQVEILDVRETRTIDWYSESPITMPVGVVELGLPGTSIPPAGALDVCRDDLLTVDGRPVAVRLTGDVGAASRRQPVQVSLCEGSLRLPAGEHELRTAPGATTGYDLDRLVLTSGVRGEAVPPPSPGSPPAATSSVALRVVDEGRASLTVEVDGDEPFWLVLGQSHSSGWTATTAPVDGGPTRDLGEPVLVDGYANGWHVTPQGGPQRVTLRFTPQRTVTAALVLSLLGALLCLVLIARSGRGPRATALDAPVDADAPSWVWPWQPVGSRPSVRWVAGVAVTGGAVAALLVHPVTGVGIAAALVLGLLGARGPGVLAGAAVALLGGAALFTIAKQHRNGYPPDFGWPGFFGLAHHLAWIGLLLIVASVAAAAVRRRAGGRDPQRTP